MALDLTNDEAERSTIGSALMGADKGSIEATLGIVTPDMFTDPRNRALMAAMRDYLDVDGELDLVAFCHYLDEHGKLGACGGKEHIVVCHESVGSQGLHYAKVVRALHYRRAVLSYLESSQSDLNCADGESWLSRADAACSKLRGLVDAADPDDHVSADTVAADLDNYYRRQIKGGYPSIDDDWIGFARGEFIVVAARPSQGKSTFVNCLTANMAKRGEKILVNSLEMSREDWLINCISREANVDGTRIRRQCMTDAERDKVVKARKEPWLKNLIFGTQTRDVRSVIGEARRIAKRVPIAVVVVDYIQLLRTGRGRSIYEELTEVSHRLKRLAQQANVCVIGVAQINRGGEEIRHRAPTMSDIKGCGDIEQDADGVYILYRPETYYPDNEKFRGRAQLVLAKNRNGARGSTWFLFRGPFFDFIELKREDHPTNAQQDLDAEGGWHPGRKTKAKSY